MVKNTLNIDKNQMVYRIDILSWIVCDILPLFPGAVLAFLETLRDSTGAVSFIC